MQLFLCTADFILQDVYVISLILQCFLLTDFGTWRQCVVARRLIVHGDLINCMLLSFVIAVHVHALTFYTLIYIFSDRNDPF